MTPIYLLAGAIVLTLIAVVLLTQSPAEEVMDVEAIARVSPAQAREAWEKNEAIILDVRSEDDYNTGHAEGAINIPLAQLETRLDELSKEKWVITYCT